MNLRAAARLELEMCKRAGESVELCGPAQLVFPSPTALLAQRSSPGPSAVKLERLHGLARAPLAGKLDRRCWSLPKIGYRFGCGGARCSLVTWQASLAGTGPGSSPSGRRWVASSRRPSDASRSAPSTAAGEGRSSTNRKRASAVQSTGWFFEARPRRLARMRLRWPRGACHEAAWER